VIAAAERCLWSERGRLAREHLREERGLREETIRRWRLGYVYWDTLEPAAAWGFEGDGTVRLPAGLLLPCLIDGACWSLKLRRPLGMPGPRYLQVRGSRAALFGACTLTADGVPRPTVFLTEGELDAILLHQEIGDLAGVATVGGAATGLDTRWLWRLRDARRIIACYDLDAAGSSGAELLAGLSARIRVLRPAGGKDLTEMWRAGVDLRSWALPPIHEDIRRNAC
jgi:hypothetical protein